MDYLVLQINLITRYSTVFLTNDRGVAIIYLI